MKVHDLVFIPYEIYLEILQDFPYLMLTQDIDHEMGLKYYCTDSDIFDKTLEIKQYVLIKQYVFEVVDAKKVILAKLKYGF